eukprot:15435616-Alexandrium_andersonii.AAC.1
MARGCDGNQPRGNASAVPRQRGTALRASRRRRGTVCGLRQCMSVLAHSQPAQTPTANKDTENMVLATGH